MTEQAKKISIKNTETNANSNHTNAKKLLTTSSHYKIHTFLAVALNKKPNGRCGSTNACK